MRKMFIVTVLISLLFLGSCSTIPAPKTPNQKLVYLHALYLEVVNTSDSLLNNHILPVKQAEYLYTALKTVKEELALADEYEAKGDATSAQTIIDGVSIILTNLQAQLAKNPPAIVIPSTNSTEVTK